MEKKNLKKLSRRDNHYCSLYLLLDDPHPPPAFFLSLSNLPPSLPPSLLYLSI